MYKKIYLKFIIAPLFFITINILSTENKSAIVQILQTKYTKILNESEKTSVTKNQLKELITEINILLNISENSSFRAKLCHGISYILTGYCTFEFMKNSLLYGISKLIFNSTPIIPDTVTYENFKNENSIFYNRIDPYTQETENFLSNLSECEAIEFKILRENITQEDFEKILNVTQIEEPYHRKERLNNFFQNALGYGTLGILCIISFLKTCEWLEQDENQQIELYNLKKEIQKKLNSLCSLQV